MTLTIYDTVEQGSEQWHELRRGILTASTIGNFITPKTIKPAANDKTRAMAYQLVAEKITGHTEDNYVSRDMEIGHLIEPLARELYSTTYGVPALEVGFMVREEDNYRIGYSPDAIVGDDGLLEIKRHLPKLHLELILADEVPAIHLAQCQTALFVSGRSWIDYLSWCGGMAMWTKRITPDPAWFDAIETVATDFEVSAADMTARYAAATDGLPIPERIDYYAYEEVELKL